MKQVLILIKIVYGRRRIGGENSQPAEKCPATKRKRERERTEDMHFSANREKNLFAKNRLAGVLCVDNDTT